MSLSEALVADFKQEASHSRKVLACVPEGRLDWKPHEKSMSLGQLASHVAETPSWIPAMMEEVFDMAAMAGSYVPYLARDRADLLATFEKNSRLFEETLAGRNDAFLRQTWTMRQGTQVLMSAHRHAAIRSTAIHHSVHHRGQLTVYLRLLGIPVPATYGPTADDPSFG